MEGLSRLNNAAKSCKEVTLNEYQEEVLTDLNDEEVNDHQVRKLNKLKFVTVSFFVIEYRFLTTRFHFVAFLSRFLIVRIGVQMGRNT